MKSNNVWSTSWLTVHRVGSFCQKVSASFVQSIGFLQPPCRTVGRSGPNGSRMYLCVDWSSIRYIKELFKETKIKVRRGKSRLASNIPTRIGKRCENNSRLTICSCQRALWFRERRNRVEKNVNYPLERGESYDAFRLRHCVWHDEKNCMHL